MNTRSIRRFASFTPSNMSNLHHRMPTTFGPFPGPRQSFNGRARDGSGISNVEAFIAFKAKQSDLVSLLPLTFSFQKPGPEAYVSITAKHLDNLEWLAGRGYNLLSVYIHGVRKKTAEHIGALIFPCSGRIWQTRLLVGGRSWVSRNYTRILTSRKQKAYIR